MTFTTDSNRPQLLVYRRICLVARSLSRRRILDIRRGPTLTQPNPSHPSFLLQPSSPPHPSNHLQPPSIRETFVGGRSGTQKRWDRSCCAGQGTQRDRRPQPRDSAHGPRREGGGRGVGERGARGVCRAAGGRGRWLRRQGASGGGRCRGADMDKPPSPASRKGPCGGVKGNVPLASGNQPRLTSSLPSASPSHSCPCPLPPLPSSNISNPSLA